MVRDTDEKDVRHPEGKLLLMNGNILDCIEKEAGPMVIQHDASGSCTDKAWRDLFFKEAFFLYEHRDAIYADSRMFLTPLPFGNNLAYTGTSGLRNATLGVYLEWWDHCDRAVIKNGGEIAALTYFIAGSPLSGNNRCNVVNRKGETKNIVFSSPFSEIWSSFMRINQRYSEAKQIYQAYTLEETIAKLREA